MTVYDLLFLVVFLTTVVMMCAAVVMTLRGSRSQAGRVMTALTAVLGAYLLTIAVVSLTTPQQVAAFKDTWCSDEWCVSVDRVDRTPSAAGVTYIVDLRLSSRSRGRPQRERGVGVYLIDDSGRHYEARIAPGAVPFDTLLQPGQSIVASRLFVLPGDANNPSLVVTHPGFPRMLIIGEDGSLFHRPRLFMLQ